MARLEEPKHLNVAVEVELLERAQPDGHLAFGMALQPFLGEIAAILAAALLSRILGISHRVRQEARAPAAEDHLEPVAIRLRPVDQLRRDILAALGLAFGWNVGVGFPVALRRLGIGRRRRCVRDARGRDDARRHARRFGQLPQRGRAVALRARAVLDVGRLRDAERAVVRFDARRHRHRRRRRIRHLAVMRVGLGEGRVGQLFHRQLVALAIQPLALAGIDARRRDGGDAHAVADEQDHVLGSLRMTRRRARLHRASSPSRNSCRPPAPASAPRPCDRWWWRMQPPPEPWPKPSPCESWNSPARSMCAEPSRRMRQFRVLNPDLRPRSSDPACGQLRD